MNGKRKTLILKLARFDGRGVSVKKRKAIRLDDRGIVNVRKTAESHGLPRESGVPSMPPRIVHGVSC